ncbi:MAG: hypothetical protein H6644_09070 [Caldilineaceae bacterium]|nr:hypothetical protein [Caldilineaceae bacterium]
MQTHRPFHHRAPVRYRTHRHVWLVAAMLLFVLAGCGRGRAQPTPTPTPLPTSTPVPTATPAPAGDAGSATDGTPNPAPVVVIPDGFNPRTDARLGYSLALPGGWTDVDLRSPRFRSMLESVGVGGQVAPLLAYLDTPAGQSVGLVAMTDLAGMVFGGLPTAINVSVLDAPGASAEDVAAQLERLLAGGVLPAEVTVTAPVVTTVNNLPAVQATATGSLASVGMDGRIYAQVTGLLAHDKVYLLSLVADEGKRTAKEEEFAQILGTFRPE